MDFPSSARGVSRWDQPCLEYRVRIQC
ncbi:hypothetical protein M6B38_116310 [Iris pallida]|uniref:Uncharacterized protein n=1 Tax=Iris pallida TaxID=29817 RepID=A0AAX6I473_IRIPA|nr:hypothetical protein M6B38_116310 [Iris pallida]